MVNNGFPFETKKKNTGYDPYAIMSEEEIFIKLEHSRNCEKEGAYRDAKAVISDMKTKYT